MYAIAPMPESLSEERRQRLLECETATIGHFHHRGFVEPQIRCQLDEVRIAGIAVTLSLPAADGTLLSHAMRLLRPGDVLVIERQGDLRHACWGGVLTEVASRTGIAGVVIDGMATDLATIRQRRFPVWSRGVSSLTTRLLNQGGSLNYPVSIGGISVRAGDIVLADENGVVVLTADEVDGVIDHTLALQLQELNVLERLAAGECLPDISGATALVEAELTTTARP